MGKPLALNLRNKLPIIAVLLSLLIVGIVGLSMNKAHALSLWPNSTTPATTSEPTSTSIEVGVKFRSSVATTISGIKFYKGSGNTGTHTGSLWTTGGTKLAGVTFTNETASGWQSAYFATPVSISANTTYVVSYFAPNGHFAVNRNYFTSDITNGTLTAPKSSTSGGNGVYRQASTSGFPTSSNRESNYWVDVISDTTAPTVAVSAPANNATVTGTTAITATASDDVAIASVQFKLDGANLGAPDTNAPYSYSWNTATAANGSRTLTAVATDTAGNSTTSANVTVTVSNASELSLWSNTDTPATPSASSTDAEELGVKFRSSVATVVTGIKFYKGSANTGTHTGSLWTASGTKLASVTFTNETASGWQYATFATPVNITANTTYVASYFAPNGRYALNQNYFTIPYTNSTLTALQNGTEGGNGVFKANATSTFPTHSYKSSNYWVDVITGGVGGDTTAPLLSNITANNVTDSNTTITWDTNEVADSRVEYGKTTSYGTIEVGSSKDYGSKSYGAQSYGGKSAEVGSMGLGHSVGLSNLDYNTTYHYRVLSTDAAGNTATSSDKTFTTQ